MQAHKYINIKVFLLFCVILLPIYLNSFSGAWVLDDLHNILENEKLHMTELNAASLKNALFAKPYTAADEYELYRPLACLTFALNWYFGQDNALGYHVVNLLIHIITALLLFVAIRLLFQTPRLRNAIDDERAVIIIAFVSALLWAVHPIQIQAVTYIVQRMTSLAGMFFIGGICCYLAARQTFRKTGKLAGYAGCLLCYAAAVGSKENAVVLPAVLLLMHWLFFLKGVYHKKHLVYWALIVCGVAAFFGAGVWYYGQTGSGYDVRPFTLGERLLTEPRVIFLYISQIFWPLPSRFQIEHFVPLSTALFSPVTTILAFAGIAALVLAAFCKAGRWPLASFAILFFLGCHVLESTFVPLELVYEHRNYVPGMFVGLPLVYGCMRLWQRYGARRPKIKSYFIMAAVLVVALLGFSTFLRNYLWQNNSLLFESVIEKYPQVSRAYNSVGVDLLKTGKPEQALAYFQKALANDAFYRDDEPLTAKLHIASAYWMMGAFPEAIAQARANLAENPDSDYFRMMLAQIYADSGETAQAREQFAALLEGNPGNFTLNYEMGKLCLKDGDGREAVRYFTAAGDSLPKDGQGGAGSSPDLSLALGRAYVLAEEYEQAASAFSAAMNTPSETARAEAALWLAGVLQMQGKTPPSATVAWLQAQPRDFMDSLYREMTAQPFLPSAFVAGLAGFVKQYL